MALILRYAAKSDVGMVRADNEDSGYAGSRMLVVADGMGGHAAGELASATAVASFAALDSDEGLQPGDQEILGVLQATVDTAYEQLGQVAGVVPESRGMGTTLTALAWLNDRVAVAHIGDSRAYLMRDGVLSQLTKDHTFVQTLVDSGRISPEEALTHERRNLLMKALDGVNDVEPDLSIREVRAGDRFLLCTDGLCGVVPEATISALMASTADPTGVVDALVEQALAAGAPDNVTALVADVVSAPDSAGVHQSPIVVGAASERRNRDRLPGLAFPEDSEPDPSPRNLTPPKPAEAGRAPRQEAPDGNAGATHAAPKRRRVHGYTVLALVAVVLIIAGVLGAWAWTRSQYFVGANQGSVAIFQGVPWGVGDHGWSTVEEVTATKVADLPEFQQEKVKANIGAASQADALRITSALADAAEECATKVPAPAGCPPRPAPPKPKPTPSPSVTPSATPNPLLSAART